MASTGLPPRCSTKQEAADWYTTNVPPSGNIFQTLTTWRQIERSMLPIMRSSTAGMSLSVEASSEPPHYTAACLDSDAYALYHVNPDADLNTLRYLFFHTRCGIWVCIRNNRVYNFLPFANEAYTNHYGDKLTLTPSDLSIDDYVRAKRDDTRRRPETLIRDRTKWWLNGGIVCNVMPEGKVWGDEYVGALYNMLVETCDTYSIPDVTFFINKRDYPQLKKDRSEPYEEFVGIHDLVRERYSTYSPVFSFYTGTDMADIPMPTTEDWGAATQSVFPPGSFDAPFVPSVCTPIDKKDRRAVFRGTATGRGITPDTNVRLRLAKFGCERPDLVDAGVTGYNFRDKVVSVSADRVIVDYVDPSVLPRKVAFMSMEDQCSRFAYVVYADGHCAASRYGTLMHSGSVILKVSSDCSKTSGILWLFQFLEPARVHVDGSFSVPVDADHFVVDSSLMNLEATIAYLREHDDIAQRVADNAKRKAPTQGSIKAYWRDCLRAVHAKSCISKSSGSREWFTPYEGKYSRVGEYKNDLVTSTT